MHISDWKPPEQDEEADAQDRALLRLQVILLAATVTVLALATAFHEAGIRLACTALAIAPC